MTYEQDLEEWLQGRPDSIRALVARLPPNQCYRGNGGRGHYTIEAYGEPVDGDEGTVRVLHGHDSFAAGFQVFGMKPGDLEPCNCGKWKEADALSTLMAESYVSAFVLDQKAKKAGH